MTVQVDAAAARHRHIMDRLDADGRVEVGDLSGRLEVAPETIRRDLRQLEGQGLLQRVHGGAVRRAERPLSPFDGTTPEHPALHVRLAAEVVERLPDRGTVLLSASPLTWAVAESMSRHPPSEPGLTVVTTGLDVAVVLSRVDNLQVYNIGGSVEPEHRAQQGDWALDEIRRFRVDLALVSPAGLTVDGGIFAATTMTAAIMAAEIEVARHVWLLMEGGDIGRPAPVRIADLARVRHVFTAGPADHASVEDLRDLGISIVGAD
ncbi:MAG: DeoR/GlpR family DNA-binding transcription regulator [Propionibacteriaceae bacterium]